MAGTKRLGFSLDPASPTHVAQSAVEIDERGRLHIPTRLIGELGWIHNKTPPFDALAVYDRPGRIVLLSWEGESGPILAKRKEFLEETQESTEAREGLLILEDRYKRLTIPKDLRPTLGLAALLHLDLPPGKESNVYLARIFESLEILSPRYRNEWRLSGSEVLAGLP